MCSGLRFNTGILQQPKHQWLLAHQNNVQQQRTPTNPPNANDINIYLKIKLRCAKFSSFKYIHKIGINNDYTYSGWIFAISVLCALASLPSFSVPAHLRIRKREMKGTRRVLSARQFDKSTRSLFHCEMNGRVLYLCGGR